MEKGLTARFHAPSGASGDRIALSEVAVKPPNIHSPITEKRTPFFGYTPFIVEFDASVWHDISVTSMTRKLLLLVAVASLFCGLVPISSRGQDGVHVSLTELTRRADRIENRVDDVVKGVAALATRVDESEKREDHRENLLTGCFISLMALVAERVAAVIFGAKAKNKTP